MEPLRNQPHEEPALSLVASERLPFKVRGSENLLTARRPYANIFVGGSLYGALTEILCESLRVVKVSIMLALSEDKDISSQIK